MKRRTFLTLGLPLLFPSLSFSNTTKVNLDKSIVLIWLGGGPSHIETFDPKPDAPVEYRPVNGVVSGKEMMLGADFSNLIRHERYLIPVHNFKHTDANHNSATHWVMTGHKTSGVNTGAPQTEPSYGSVVSHSFGDNINGLPTYVKTGKIVYDEEAWLDVTHKGYEAYGEGVNDLFLKVSQDRFASRIEMLSQIDRKSDFGKYGDFRQLREQAEKFLTGQDVRVFNTDLDDKKEFYEAGKNSFGKNLLLTRRLVEAGIKFITVNHPGWDMHTNISDGMKNRARELDKYLSLFVQDMSERGLLSKTLIIVAGEFGRTPKVNSSSGRDHWAGLSGLLFITQNGGYIVGESNDKGEIPVGVPTEPKDLLTTVFDYMGMDKHIQAIDNQGRPKYLNPDGKAIITV